MKINSRHLVLPPVGPGTLSAKKHNSGCHLQLSKAAVLHYFISLLARTWVLSGHFQNEAR